MWPSGTDGLPIGVQLIAAPWREDLALRAGWTLAQSGAAHVKEAAL
jgi:amidase/aspartyl-tRNA(Asn)/glutamyl-tRNA(Gln) amidotransferase subunit A